MLFFPVNLSDQPKHDPRPPTALVVNSSCWERACFWTSQNQLFRVAMPSRSRHHVTSQKKCVEHCKKDGDINQPFRQNKLWQQTLIWLRAWREWFRRISLSLILAVAGEVFKRILTAARCYHSIKWIDRYLASKQIIFLTRYTSVGLLEIVHFS